MKTCKPFFIILVFAFFLLGNAGHVMLPQVFISTQTRAPISDTKSNLHNLYLACKAYWADEGSAEPCSVNTASQEKYGYVKSKGVTVHVAGAENDFCAVAWHQDTQRMFSKNSIGQIAEQSEFALEPNWKIHPPEKLWIYENFAPRNIYYFSAVLIVPLVTLIITFWSGGNVILKEKRKYPLLTFGLLIAAWAFIVLATIGLAGDIYSYYTLGGDTVISLLIILPVVYAIKLGFSLLKWGRELEREKELPGDLKNLQSKALKRSGAFLLGAIGVLLVINVAYGFSYDGGRKNYLTQSDEFVKEFQETIQKDPAQLQKVCQPPASSP